MRLSWSSPSLCLGWQWISNRNSLIRSRWCSNIQVLNPTCDRLPLYPLSSHSPRNTFSSHVVHTVCASAWACNYRGKAKVNVTTGLFLKLPLPLSSKWALTPGAVKTQLQYSTNRRAILARSLRWPRYVSPMTSVNWNRRVACLCSLRRRSTRLIVEAFKLTLTAQHCLWRMLHSLKKLGLRPCSNGCWCAADHLSSSPSVAVADGGS